VLLFVPGAVLLTSGISSFGTDAMSAAEHDLHLSDSDATVIRNDFRASLREQNPFFLAEEQALLSNTGAPLPDTNSVEIHPQTQRLAAYFQKNATLFVNSYLLFFFGGLLLLIGCFTLIASSIDLSCQIFEERPQEPIYALWSGLRGNTWKISLLYILYTIAVVLINTIIGVFPVQVGSVLAFFLMIAQIYILVRLAAVFPAMISEELGPFEAVRRSWELTRHLGWRIFAFSLAFGLVLIFVSIVVSEVTGLLFPNITSWAKDFLIKSPISFQWFIDTLPGILWSIVAEISLFLLFLFFSLPSFLTVLYYDLRTRHDGPLVYVEDAT